MANGTLASGSLFHDTTDTFTGESPGACICIQAIYHIRAGYCETAAVTDTRVNRQYEPVGGLRREPNPESAVPARKIHDVCETRTAPRSTREAVE